MSPSDRPESLAPDGSAETAPVATKRRSIPVLVIVAVVVALLSGLTWVLGGFDEATGRQTRIVPGTPVAMGPLTITPQTARGRRGYSDEWTINVFAMCQNTSDQPVTSSGDRLARNGFGAQDPRTLRVVGDASLSFGDIDGFGSDSVLNPGTPPVPCTVTFDFGKEFEPSDHVRFGVSVMEWIDVSPTGEGNMAWSSTRDAYQFDLPLVIDPPR